METIALFLYPVFMVFELLLFAVLAITLFLSMIVSLLTDRSADQFIVGTLFIWVIGNVFAFLVYLGVSALH